MRVEDVRVTLAEPMAQELMAARIPARLAYTALDGTPRVVPMGYAWTGSALVMATVAKAPKVAALEANPVVALTVDTNEQPPHVLLVRGTTSIEIVDGVPDVFLDGARKLVAPEAWEGFEAGVRALYDRMAVLTVTPTWARLYDFETRVPDVVAKQAAARGL
ncbi:MAG: pyridoxamine 5'-phosphate oxidase family protein [Pseudonocardia sp.]|uniref:pyridoxamine 5'-phosphate oxidase family protein n=1 Tax=unclassified Pseudonocardia TaxID=2619320 RepID=UPI00086847F2|nr:MULTISPECIES: pyridoxamine 5'-phosphate oxidase family protein [unclassified Pseudonocardia]MBN9111029.1 pyridoxamine 5'-phosphate oxidase family protein [Pseudonocardia sp.]ODU02934.1 MAG: pyridoxamine 5-phosphate oxidase [Pseudonocardia sp. SCN 72-51]ODV05067.1 MAG: pyridoxamine 5-phosphate oxidase [Pseudonocardia sp. SCN 73-27]